VSTPTATLAFPAVLTHREARACLSQWVAALPSQGDVWLEASGLQRFDSSALAVLLACQRAARGKGCTLRVRGLPQRARQLAQVYGIETSLGLTAASNLSE
jgi:phospholipid transport system transporter-binding protein